MKRDEAKEREKKIWIKMLREHKYLFSKGYNIIVRRNRKLMEKTKKCERSDIYNIIINQ